MLDATTIIDLALPLLALACLGVSALAWRRARRAERRWAADLALLRRDLAALWHASREAGDRLLDVERQSHRLRQRLEAVALHGPPRDNVRHAIALVQRGASADDLVRTCGLGRGEAELLTLLHHANDVANQIHKNH